MTDFDFEPPSFSLGLDLDSDSEPQPTIPCEPLFQEAKSSSPAGNRGTIEEAGEDDFESPVRLSDRPRALKRLRRGPAPKVASEAKESGSEDGRCNVDDQIEEFSSDEDCPRGNFPPSSICASSKASLHGRKVVTSESGSHWKSGKGKEVSSALASANIETKGNNAKFPKLTASPLRRFQLIDSDSDFDDPLVIEDTSKEVPCVNVSPKGKQSVSGLGTEKTSVRNYRNEDLWKDFASEKSFCIPTPAFDEICNEYFTNIQSKTQTESYHHNNPITERKSTGTDLPPAHYYFFHKDLRIQKLVRDRLPYFFPLEARNNLENKLQNESVIDYMGQFGNEENSRQTQHVVEKSSASKKKIVKKSPIESISQDSSTWVNPKSNARPPKNAGNRRVQADNKSAGHWFTDSSGRKVYVNKKGEELSGQIAYRHYRKESGMGFRNSKKKAAGKKKSGAQKKAASKKK